MSEVASERERHREGGREIRERIKSNNDAVARKVRTINYTTRRRARGGGLHDKGRGGGGGGGGGEIRKKYSHYALF